MLQYVLLWVFFFLPMSTLSITLFGKYIVNKSNNYFDTLVPKKIIITKYHFCCKNKAMKGKLLVVLMQSLVLTNRVCHLTFIYSNFFFCHKLIPIFKVFSEDNSAMVI